jgi:hypothetical protein
MEDKSINPWLFEKANLQLPQIRHSTLEDYCKYVRFTCQHVFFLKKERESFRDPRAVCVRVCVCACVRVCVCVCVCVRARERARALHVYMFVSVVLPFILLNQ